MNGAENPQPTHRGLVTIVLPARNEETAIGKTLRSLPLSTLRALGFESEVIVLDGRSEDRTAEIARAWGARVLPDPEPGKGAALRHARSGFRGEYTVMLDADGTYPPDAIPRVLSELSWGGADIVMGSRLPQPGSMKGSHLLGNVMLSIMASVLYRRFCPDVCTGLWGFRTEALRTLPLQSQGFGLEAELFALASRLGYRIQQLRFDYLPRNGRAKLSGGHDGLRIVRRLMRSRFAPLKGPARPDGQPRMPTTAPGEARA